MGKFITLFAVICLMVGGAAWHQSRKEEIRMVALGDSITYGTGAPKGEGYVEKVKRQLEESLSIPIRIENFGVPKYRTEDILQVIEKRRKALQKADYLFLYIGTNDFRKAANYEFTHLDPVSLGEGKDAFRADMEKIIRKIRVENPVAPLLMLGLYHPYTEYENQLEIRHFLEEWNEVIAHLAEGESNLFYLPTMDLFLEEEKETVFSDSLHLNEEGYERLAERVQDWVLEREKTSNRE